MSGSYYIPDPAQRVEQVILSYISSSFYGEGLIDPAVNFYTGMDTPDKEGPAIVVACNEATETYFQTKVYRFDVDVTTKQIAWDAATASLGGTSVTSSVISFGGNVHSLFGDSNTASLGINLCTASGSNDFWIYQVQQNGYQSIRVEDAWISNQKLTVIGMLAPPAVPLPYTASQNGPHTYLYDYPSAQVGVQYYWQPNEAGEILNYYNGTNDITLLSAAGSFTTPFQGVYSLPLTATDLGSEIIPLIWGTAAYLPVIEV